jgi:uncharacterized membrane protein
VSETPLRRRFDRALVRYQARIEGGPGDRWIPNLLALGLAFWLAQAGLGRLEGYDTGVDLASYGQGLWLLTQGFEPRTSLFGSDVHLLEVRWSFILYPLSLFALFATPVKVLIVSQAVALGAATLPLWRLGREVAKLRVGATTALVLAYALHPATHRLAVDDFHPVVLALPALLGMAYFGSTRRWIGYWLCVVFALACRADLGLAIGLWGLVLIGDGQRRHGVWTLGACWTYALGLLLVAQPLAGPSGVGRNTGYDGRWLGDLVLDSLRNPLTSIESIVSQESLALLVALLAPVIFLPLLSLRHVLPALPLIGLYLLSGPVEEAPFAERAAMLLAFVVIATPFALNRLANKGVDRVFLDPRLLFTLTSAAVLLFVSSAATSPYERPWSWSTQDDTDQAIAEAVGLLDDDVPVRASPSALAALSERPWLFALPTDTTPSAVNMGFPDFTRAVLIVERELPPRSEDERREFDRTMASLGFERAFDADGVVLYGR